jgi:hypothetical protein
MSGFATDYTNPTEGKVSLEQRDPESSLDVLLRCRDQEAMSRKQESLL